MRRGGGEEVAFGERLLGLPIRFGDVHLGRVADLLVDVRRGVVIGFEIACPDEEQRFLPLPAVEIRGEGIQLSSPLTLLDSDEASFYRKRGLPLAAVRGPAAGSGAPAAVVEDVYVAPDGTIDTLVLGTDSGPITVPFEPGCLTAGALVSP
jgi:hypothetical protein